MSKCPFGKRDSGSEQICRNHERQIVTLDVPAVSADVFITLVLALLPVTTILTAGVDTRPLDPRPPRALVRLCLVLVPYSDIFQRVNKKTIAKLEPRGGMKGKRATEIREESGETR